MCSSRLCSSVPACWKLNVFFFFTSTKRIDYKRIKTNRERFNTIKKKEHNTKKGMEKQLCLLFWICIVLLILYSVFDREKSSKKGLSLTSLDGDSLLVVVVVRNGNGGILDSLFRMADDPSCVEVLVTLYKKIILPEEAKSRRNQVHILHKVDQGTLSEERKHVCEKYGKGRFVLLLHENVRMERGWDTKVKHYISKLDSDDVLTVHPPADSATRHGFPVMREDGNLGCLPFHEEGNKDLTPSVLLSPILILSYEGLGYECRDSEDVTVGTQFVVETKRTLLTCTSSLVHFTKEPRKWKVDGKDRATFPSLVSLKTGLTQTPTDKECILKYGSVIEAKREWKREGKKRM